jgi:hypothetical protein
MRAYWRVDRCGESTYPARKQVLTTGELSPIDPCEQGLPGLLRDFELNRSARFTLHYDRSVEDAVSMGDVFHAKANQVTATQLTIDGKVEESKIAPAFGEL